MHFKMCIYHGKYKKSWICVSHGKCSFFQFAFTMVHAWVFWICICHGKYKQFLHGFFKMRFWCITHGLCRCMLQSSSKSPPPETFFFAFFLCVHKPWDMQIWMCINQCINHGKCVKPRFALAMGYANLNVHKLLYKPWQMHKITVCVTHGICKFKCA